MTDELNLATFSPTIAELQSLVAVAQKVDVNNLTQVRGVRISLKNERVRIEKRGKEYRADAIRYQKAVIAKEHELIAIIEPEEIRLDAIEEEVKIKKIMAERVALLPERWAKIDAIGHPKGRSDLHDDFLLGLDATIFQDLLNRMLADKNLIEQARIDADRAKIDEERAKLAHDKELAEREENARQQERDRAERTIREEREAADRRAKEAEARAVEAAKDAERRVQAEKDAAIQREKERIEREAKEKAEAEETAKQTKIIAEIQQKARENQQAYKDFMARHGLLENVSKEHLEQFQIVNDNRDPQKPKVRLYKLIDTLELKI